MKKIQKNKKGFTLIEMVLVVAIILILAAVMIMGIGTYMQTAKSAADSVSMHNATLENVSSQIDSIRASLS